MFASRDGQFRFTFLEAENHAIAGMVWGNLFVLEKVPWYETVGFQRSLLGAFLLVFVMATVARPLARLFRHRRTPVRDSAVARGRLGTFATLALTLSAGVNALFLMGLLLILPRAFDLGMQFGMPPALAVLFAAPVLTTALAAVLVALALPLVRARTWPGPVLSAYCVYAMVAVAFVPFLVYWNVLGLHW